MDTVCIAATDYLSAMCVPLRPEAQQVDPMFAGIDEAVALAEADWFEGNLDPDEPVYGEGDL